MRGGSKQRATDDTGLVPRAKRAYRSVADFFGHQIWAQRLEDMSPRRARMYQLARIVDVTFRGLVFGDTLHVHAAALTYFSVLSIVPLLAFAFALLKGFGVYEALVRDSLRPYILDLLEGNEALRTAFQHVLDFVEQTDVTSLGFLGLLALLYAATRLLRNIEGALNEIWDLPAARALLQQLRDYVMIIVVVPLCLMAAALLTTASQVLELVRSISEKLGLHGVLETLLGVLTPLLVLFFGLLFLYKVMPHASIKPISAVLGAAVGSVLWYIVLIVHVRFQVGVARYNALYSSFGAIPIFLAWQHISWLVVLVGAQVASAHQNHRSVAQRRRSNDFTQGEKEVLCLAAVLAIARSSSAEQPGPSVHDLSIELDAPEPLLRQLLESLDAAALLQKTEDDKELAYTLARPAEEVRIKDLLDALRVSGPNAWRELSRSTWTEAAHHAWSKLDLTTSQAEHNHTLQELVQQAQPDAKRTAAR